jgi:hypothetical protein
MKEKLSLFNEDCWVLTVLETLLSNFNKLSDVCVHEKVESGGSGMVMLVSIKMLLHIAYTV